MNIQAAIKATIYTLVLLLIAEIEARLKVLDQDPSTILELEKLKKLAEKYKFTPSNNLYNGYSKDSIHETQYIIWRGNKFIFNSELCSSEEIELYLEDIEEFDTIEQLEEYLISREEPKVENFKLTCTIPILINKWDKYELPYAQHFIERELNRLLTIENVESIKLEKIDDDN